MLLTFVAFASYYVQKLWISSSFISPIPSCINIDIFNNMWRFYVVLWLRRSRAPIDPSPAFCVCVLKKIIHVEPVTACRQINDVPPWRECSLLFPAGLAAATLLLGWGGGGGAGGRGPAAALGGAGLAVGCGGRCGGGDFFGCRRGCLASGFARRVLGGLLASRTSSGHEEVVIAQRNRHDNNGDLDIEIQSGQRRGQAHEELPNDDEGASCLGRGGDFGCNPGPAGRSAL